MYSTVANDNGQVARQAQVKRLNKYLLFESIIRNRKDQDHCVEIQVIIGRRSSLGEAFIDVGRRRAADVRGETWHGNSVEYADISAIYLCGARSYSSTDFPV